MNDDLNDGRAASARARGRKVRIEGRDWLIYELAATSSEPASLVFETELIVRRVKAYPANWQVLDDAALFAVSWKR